MKKIIFALCTAVILFSCSQPSSNDNNNIPPEEDIRGTYTPVIAVENISFGGHTYEKTGEVYAIAPGQTDHYSYSVINNQPIASWDSGTELECFIIGKYEVTQELYEAVINGNTDGITNPSRYLENNIYENEHQNLRAVDSVLPGDAYYFCNKLSELMGLEPYYTITNINNPGNGESLPDWSGHIVYAEVTRSTEPDAKYGYRLPTKEEWEYAARGGRASNINCFNRPYPCAIGMYNLPLSINSLIGWTEDLDRIAWYDFSKGHHEVGLKNCNTLGLYDMALNAGELLYPTSYSNINTTNQIGYRAGVGILDHNYFHGGGSEFYITDFMLISGSSTNLGGHSLADLLHFGFRVCRTAKPQQSSN